jgi:hypothetical protein
MTLTKYNGTKIETNTTLRTNNRRDQCMYSMQKTPYITIYNDRMFIPISNITYCHHLTMTIESTL